MIYTDIINTPLGGIRARAQGDTLTGLWFIGQKYFPLGSDEWIEKSNYPVFKDLRTWLSKYFSGENPDPTILLDPPGTDFQKSVWRVLRTIPYGQVRTYGEIAKQIARGKAAGYSPAQAVGNAVGHNPISLLIPCHRVIGADGSLRGYAGGLDKKSALLTLEAPMKRRRPDDVPPAASLGACCTCGYFCIFIQKYPDLRAPYAVCMV